MRNKRIAVLLIAVLHLAMLSGCQLAREDEGENGDRLVGVFVTTEYIDLFDMESYLNDNLRAVGGDIAIDGDTSAYEGRLYAARVEEEGDRPDTYTFEGLDGSAFYSLFSQDGENEEGYYHSVVSGGISDAHSHYTVTDEGERIELSASIYFEADGSSPEFYCNPVYQTEDGQIYLTSGSGISTDGVLAEGTMMSQKLEETSSTTMNGGKEEFGLSVEIQIVGVYLPEKYVLIRMSEDDQVLDREEYIPGRFPEEIKFDAETAYVLLKGQRTNGEGEPETFLEVYDRLDSCISTMESLSDGVCTKRDIPITWK